MEINHSAAADDDQSFVRAFPGRLGAAKSSPSSSGTDFKFHPFVGASGRL
jgi:hypothetical protein